MRSPADLNCLPRAPIPPVTASSLLAMSTLATSTIPDPQAERQLAEFRERTRTPPQAIELRLGFALSAAFLAASVALPLLVGLDRPFDPLVAAILVVLLAGARRVEFEVGTGYTVPIILAFVPMLFLVPTALVPACVGAGYVLGSLVDVVLGRRHIARSPLALGHGWHAMGPVLVFLAAGVSTPTWSGWLAYLLAFLAGILTGEGSQLLVDHFAYRAPLRSLVGPAAWVHLVDALLAPIGLVVACAATLHPGAVLALVPLLGLLAIFGGERKARMDQALELSSAYRGTALLLGDMVEHDHEYTGSHSRDVVELSLEVADALGLDARQRRNVEFGALLHDVGKIAVPKEIINKPGPLDDEEWAVMRRHTIEGERMLRSVGGALSEVGRVVRASHEDYDGTGYPDGLAGEDIPIEARICSACDAYSAMTTDRSYRSALSLEVAIGELRANAGTQFDPRVVDALVGVLLRDADRPEVAAALAAGER
jgi:putative nucleotidyltransferase with HDIG domain